MRKKYFMPRAADKRLAWLKGFYESLLKCFKDLGLDDDDMTALLNDINVYDYTLVLQTSSEKYYHACTKFRVSMLGSAESEFVRKFPSFSMPSNIPIPVKAGIILRVLLLIRKIKVHEACDKVVSKSLGIVGADVLEDYNKMKPEITVTLKAGFVLLKFIRHYADGLIIECMRGDETEFTYLDNLLTTTTFTDKRANLIADKAETRHYRAWYTVGDVKIGLVSDIVTIAVVGA